MKQVQGMVTKFIVILLAICWGNLAFANEGSHPAPQVAKWYKVYWSGIHVADMIATVEDKKMDIMIDSYGIAKTLSKFSSKTRSTFVFKDGRYVPASYYSAFTQRRGDRSIDINYNTEGVITSEVVNPPDKSWKRPPVEDDKKVGAYDPVTVFLAARNYLKMAHEAQKNYFSLPVYDGRRLSRIHFHIVGEQIIEVEDTKHDVVKVVVSRDQVAGFAKREMKRSKEEEPTITFYFSNDEHFMPIKAFAQAPIGTAVMLLEKTCSSVADCTPYGMANLD